MSPLVLGEMLGVFVNTWENLKDPIQMKFCEKRIPFCEVFFPFLESTSNFENSERKDDRHSSCISEIIEC